MDDFLLLDGVDFLLFDEILAVIQHFIDQIDP